MGARARVAARVLGAVLVVQVLALVVPAGTAQAATAPDSRVYAITPGTTPMVPKSVVTDSSNVQQGAVSKYLSGLIWSGTQVLQSIQQAGYDAITRLNGGSITSTGYGYASQVSCTMKATMGSGSWVEGTNSFVLPLTLVSKVYGSTLYTQADCDAIPYNVTVDCLSRSNGSHQTHTLRVLGNQVNPSGFCRSGTTTIGVPITAKIDPTDATQRAGGTDGGRWTNPDYLGVVSAQTIITTQVTCAPIPPATTPAVSTVSLDGPMGSGYAPSASCPAGTYKTSQSVYSHLPGGGTPTPLASTSLAPNALSAYKDCLVNGCPLAVALNGVKCLVSVQACVDWWSESQKPGGGGVSCSWGNYPMPVSDCAPLTNCYQVPVASLGGDASSCGIDPQDSAPYGELPAPLQDGKIYAPPAPSPSSTSGTSGTNGPTAPAPQVNVTVNVPQPTVNVSVNVPQPTVNVSVNVPQPTVIVNAPNQGPVDIPGGRPGSDCWPSGVAAFNPLDWVYTPLHCVLSPTPGKAGKLLEGPRDNGPFKDWEKQMGDMARAFEVAPKGCEGPAVNLAFDLGPAGKAYKVIHPASACSEPAASIARVCRIGCAAGLIIAGFFASFASILSGIGFSIRAFTGAGVVSFGNVETPGTANFDKKFSGPAT